MFGLVSRTKHDAEVAARQKAESHVELLRGVLLRLTDDLTAERAEHRAERSELLTLVETLSARPALLVGATAHGPESGGAEVLAATPEPVFNSAELGKMEAVGKRGLAHRQRLVRDAETREHSEAEDRRVRRQQRSLTPEEQAEVNKNLPLH